MYLQTSRLQYLKGLIVAIWQTPHLFPSAEENNFYAFSESTGQYLRFWIA